MKTPLKILGLLNMAIAFLCCGSKAYAAGATTPFKTYEGEAGARGGGASVVTFIRSSVEAHNRSSAELEASGHAYAQLTATGQSLTWTNNTGRNITALNVRFCIPDAPNGGGTTGTLNLYVNGILRQAVAFNSAQQWQYETDLGSHGTSKIPAPGLYPHQFWDETHFFITGAPVAPGSTIMFKQDAANTAAFYRIDCVDVENPPPPLIQPANSLSITDYGAEANNLGLDSTAAIQDCFKACQAQGKIAWIPSGTFYLKTPSKGLTATGITIQGAGMWYSVIHATVNTGSIIEPFSTSVQDIMFDSSATGPHPGEGGLNVKGNNWTIDRVWAQHIGAGIWAAGSNGKIENCRTSTTWGDGININTGLGITSNYLIVNNNFIRGSGDDGLAVNPGEGIQMINPTITNNTVVAPWWANNLAIYGGLNVFAANNLCTDSVTSQGLNLGTFAGWGLFQSGIVKGNTILRGGAYGGGHKYGALNIGNEGNQTVQNIVIANNIIKNSIYSGIIIKNSWEVDVENNLIDSPGLDGIAVNPETSGNGVFGNNTITNIPAGRLAIVNNSPSTYTMISGISAVSCSSKNAVQAENCSEGGADVVSTGNGAYTRYNNLNLNGMTFFQARVASPGGGTITIRLDSPAGTVVGIVPVPKTGGRQNWTTVNYHLGRVSGTHGVCLIYTPGMSIQWFNFQPNIGGSPDNLPRNGELINLVCKKSGMALNNGNSATNGAAIKQLTLANNPSQQWKVVNVGGGYVGLVCQANGMALDNSGSSSNGTGIRQLTPMANNPNQQWMFVPVRGEGGYYNLVCRAGGKVLDNGNSTADGATVIQWKQGLNNPNQEWKAVSIPRSGSVYQLICEKGGKAIDNGDSTSSGHAVKQWDKGNGNPNQEWKLVDVGGGYCNLLCQKSGMALDNNNSTSGGAGVVQGTPQAGSPNQMWKLVDLGGGQCNLICKKSGMALDNNGSTENGTDIIQGTPEAGNTKQKWTLKFIR